MSTSETILRKPLLTGEAYLSSCGLHSRVTLQLHNQEDGDGYGPKALCVIGMRGIVVVRSHVASKHFI